MANSAVPSPKRPEVSAATAVTTHSVWLEGSLKRTVARPSRSVTTLGFQYAVSRSRSFACRVGGLMEAKAWSGSPASLRASASP